KKTRVHFFELREFFLYCVFKVSSVSLHIPLNTLAYCPSKEAHPASFSSWSSPLRVDVCEPRKQKRSPKLAKEKRFFEPFSCQPSTKSVPLHIKLNLIAI
ncbi:TPA: hypothetical protein ACT2FS_002090, partial [Streptococcus suis]